jgi:CrcB protein
MNTLLAVALGGAIGAGARHLFNLQALRLFGPNFPWGTIGVNIIGSLLMGVIAGLFAFKVDLSPEWRSFLATGILGGFTTFSAFSLDAANLMQRGDMGLAVAYMGGSIAAGIGALFLGLFLVKAMLSV